MTEVNNDHIFHSAATGGSPSQSSPPGSSNDHWWKSFIRLDDDQVLDSISTIQELSRCMGNRFLEEKLPKDTYYHICIIVWLVQIIEDGSGDPQQLWKIVRDTMSTTCANNNITSTTTSTSSTAVNDYCNERSLSQLVLPSTMEHIVYGQNSNPSNTFNPLEKLIDYFSDFYKESERPFNDQPQRKRRKLNYGNILVGRYQLPTAYLLTTVIYNISKKSNRALQQQQRSEFSSENEETIATLTWDFLHKEVHRQLKPFKNLTFEHIQAGLAIFGLELLKCGKALEGLTPKLLLNDYVSRIGENLLSKLKDATGMDYYWLRALLTEHLLQPVFANTLMEDEQNETISLCSCFLNKEWHQTYIDSLDQNSKTPTKLGSAVSLSYPLLQHLSLFLLNDDVDRAMQIVRDMEPCPYLDEASKDAGWLYVWQHFLSQGNIFLDGHTHFTPGYYEKRERFYNVVVCGMGAIGREATKAFFEKLAERIYNHPDASQDERRYVLKACQQTLLRIFFKCKGLGSSTIQYFLECTEWPVPIGCPALGTGGGVDSFNKELECWAEKFLRELVPIPSSLLDEDQLLELERLVGKPYEPPSEPQFLSLSGEVSDEEQSLPEGEEEIEEESQPEGEEDEMLQQQQRGEEGQEMLHQRQQEEEEEEEEEEQHHKQEEEEPREGEEDEEEEQHHEQEEEEPQPQPRQGEQEEDIVLLDDSDEEVRREAEEEDEDDGVVEILDSDEEEEYEEQREDIEYNVEALAADEVDPEVADSIDEPVEAYESEDTPMADGPSEAESDDEPHNERTEDGEEKDGEFEEYDDDGSEEAVDLEDKPSADIPSEAEVEEDIEEEAYNESRVGFSAERPEEVVEEEQQVGKDYSGQSSEDEKDNDWVVQDHERVNDDVARVVAVCNDSKVIGHEASKKITKETCLEKEITGFDDNIETHGDEKTKQNVDNHGNVENVEQQSGGGTPTKSAVEPSLPMDDIGGTRKDGGKTEKESMEDTRDTANPVDSTKSSCQDVAGEQSPRKVEETAALWQDGASSFPGKTHETISVGQDSSAHKDSAVVNRDDPGDVVGSNRSSPPSKGKEPTSDGDQPTIDDDDHQSMEEKGSTRNDGAVDSDATDDEQERVLEVEKAETEIAAVGGEFGDTTEEEGEDEDGKANRAAMANRRADLRANRGYHSQLEEGYEPEDTHGYTEESEAIHTDEDEDRRTAQEARGVVEVEPSQPKVTPVPRKAHINPHSSDDMDAADEHTEQEEDLGAESSELEESTEVPNYSASHSPSAQQEERQQEERGSKTLWEYAQTAQRQHDSSLQKKAAADEERAEEEDKGRSPGPSSDKPPADPSSDVVDYSAEPYGTEGSKSRDSEPTESDMLQDPVHGAYTESETNDESKAVIIARKAQSTKVEHEAETEKTTTKVCSPMKSLPTIEEDKESSMGVDKETPTAPDAETENDAQTSEVAAESTEAMQGSVVDSNDGGSVGDGQKVAAKDDFDGKHEESEEREISSSAIANPASTTPVSGSGNVDASEGKKAPNQGVGESVTENLSPGGYSQENPHKTSMDEKADDNLLPDAETSASGRRLFDEDSEAQADKEDNSVVSEMSGTKGRNTFETIASSRNKDPSDAEDDDSVASSTQHATQHTPREGGTIDDDNASETSAMEAETSSRRSTRGSSRRKGNDDDDPPFVRQSPRRKAAEDDGDSVQSSSIGRRRSSNRRRKNLDVESGDESVASRTRGRNKQSDDESIATSRTRRSASRKAAAVTPAKKRGRPPKIPKTEDESAPVKRRGRAPKAPKTEDTADTPKKRGRPPKAPKTEDEPAPAKRRGRPPKTEDAADTPKKRGHPPKVPKTEDEPAPAKRRGRPPKTPKTEDESAPAKKRGRPSKTLKTEDESAATRKSHRARKPKTRDD